MMNLADDLQLSVLCGDDPGLVLKSRLRDLDGVDTTNLTPRQRQHHDRVRQAVVDGLRLLDNPAVLAFVARECQLAGGAR